MTGSKKSRIALGCYDITEQRLKMAKSPKCNTIGQIYRQFRVNNVVEIAELQCTLIELTHLPTGAQVMHIANEDPENVFCLSFQTIPTTSNGVAHILEHTVLCGSKKFPVKDPFFAMQRRSLNTYMNALTGADFTCYPAASQVPADFYNLLEVYIDAVFHPNLAEYSFLQEGHRLEFAIPTDPTSSLEYKGIVFNEMKGALSSPSTRLSELISETLFPDLTYGVNSGGDPKNIPQLTYAELKSFHEGHYHPSRCLFFFYGNLPLEGHLDFIHKHILKDAKHLDPLPAIPFQPRFKAPKIVQQSYPIDADENTKDKTLIAFAWLTCSILEQQELLALTILEIILLDTDASPLKMALLRSGLCTQVSAYIEDEITEVPLVIYLKGCNPGDEDKLDKVIRNSLEEFIETGIPLEMVENALHQLEFHRSEIVGDSFPFGLSLFLRSALLKQHGGNPISGLKIHSLFDEVRKRNLEDPTYLPHLIKKHILDNPHHVRITLTPDKELAAKEVSEEKAILSAIKDKLSAKEKKAIVDRSSALAAFQLKQDEEDVDVLPKISLEEIPRQARIYPLLNEKIGNLQVYHHSCFTNEIVYADLVFNLPTIAEEDLSYLRLMTTLMAQMGCGKRDYVKNLEYIQAHTGGIGASLTMNLQASDHNQFQPSLYIRGKALYRKVNKLFSLIGDMVTSIDFDDKKRLREVILKQYTGLQSSLNQNALKYAVNLASSGLDIPSKIANEWYGLEYYWKIKQLAQDFDAQADWLINKLCNLQSTVLNIGQPDLIITCDASMYDAIKGQKLYGLEDLEPSQTTPWQPNYTLTPTYSQGRVIASPIAFNSKVIKTVSYTHPDAPALNIAAFLCDNLTLHPTLREQGGAYGGGAVNNAMAANFYFYSYRDPNIASTFKAFDTAIKNIHSGDFDETDLEEATLEMVQTLDSPVAPGNRGDLAYGWLREGKTTEIRQTYREKILSLTKEDVIGAIGRHLIPKLDDAPEVSFASRNMLEKENLKRLAEGKDLLPIESI